VWGVKHTHYLWDLCRYKAPNVQGGKSVTDRQLSRRRFLQLGAAAGAGGLASFSGCAMTQGSIDPSMSYVMGRENLMMTKGAPAQDAYPASPSQIEMQMPNGEHMEMEAVTVMEISPTDDSNNYHFMPHVAWVEPGQTVFWEHYNEPGFSERRTHTATSFGSGGLFPRMLPQGAHHFDSQFRAGTHGAAGGGDPTIDERFNRKMVRLLGQEGGFAHTFEQEGVYMYYCQNHHEFRMAGAIVCGELWGENGNGGEGGEPPAGWAPAMTRDPHELEAADELHGTEVAHQIEELRTIIHAGQGGMAHGEEEGGHSE